MISSLAVEPAFRKRGIGTKLFSECLGSLDDIDSGVTILTAWKSRKGIHITSIARKFGFRRIFEIPGYWKEDSIKRGYKCPSCGYPPCICSAVIYVRIKP